MTPWWLGLSPARATVSCGEHEHRLRWDRGRLKALDHGDPEDERALAALGGEPFACIELLDAWERHTDDARALVLGTRGPTDLVHIDPDSLPRGAGISGLYPARRAGASMLANRRARAAPVVSTVGTAAMIGAGRPGYAPAGPRPGRARVSKQARSEAERLWLLSLGGGIPDRLMATVAATWSRRIGSGSVGLHKVRAQLHAALLGLFAALRVWLGESAPAVDLIMIDATGAAVADPQWRSGARRAAVQLAGRGLVQGPGHDLRTVLPGRESNDGKRWRLTTVAPDLGHVEAVTVSLPGARGP